MNQVFIGVLALIISFILWSSKKQSKGSLFLNVSKDSSPTSNGTASLVLESHEELINNKQLKQLKNLKSRAWSNQASLRPIEINKELTKLISSNPNDRFLAIQIASQWKNRKAIPFLKRGLKDSDSRVVIAAAAAMTTFKGKPIELKKAHPSRPPRNVSLIR
tara:strand:- start:137 stop:622 length:486 start_codon:yes stop_codon:yes gene_type:complete